MRLNKYISETGACSRREADKWIEAGRVTCNGSSRRPRHASGGRRRGAHRRRAHRREEKADLHCAQQAGGHHLHHRPQVEDNIIEFIGHSERIFPIGRLDKDSEGLILLTNDGDIVNEILRSENNHEKEYVVTVNRPITDLALSHDGERREDHGRDDQALQGDAGRPRHLSHDAHSGAEPADPPHVLGARLPGAAAAARAHHQHRARYLGVGPMALPDATPKWRDWRARTSGSRRDGQPERSTAAATPSDH